jgi:hypothetical protein
MRKTFIAIAAAISMASPAGAADAVFEAAVRPGQACSGAKAIKYARETAELAQTIAEAAYDACESLWTFRFKPPEGEGRVYTQEQINADPSIMAGIIAKMKADIEAYGLAARREAEIKRLRVLVLETRTGAPK